MSDPYFSIIIPTYNRASHITNAINSVLAQTFADFELIVVDDGSTDNTEEVVKRFQDPRIMYFKKQNEERNIARNYGAEQSRGKYVNFLDSDDALFDFHLEEAFKLIDALDTPEFIYFRIGYRDEKGSFLRSSRELKGDLNKCIIEDNVIQCNGVFLRRDVILSIPFSKDPKFILSEDWYLWLKLGSRFRLHYTNKVTAMVTEHSTRSWEQASSEVVRYCREKLLSELYSDNSFLSFYKRRLNKFKASNYTLIALHYQIEHEFSKALKYLIKAFLLYPPILAQKRFLAVMRNISKQAIIR